MKEDNNHPLPPEFSWENMKDGIFDKMKSMQSASSVQKKANGFRKRFGIFLILFFASSLALFFISREIIQHQRKDTHSAINLSNSDSQNNTPIDKGNENSEDQIEQPNTSLVEKNKKTLADDTPLSNGESSPIQSIENINKPLKTTHQLEGSQKLNNSNPKNNLFNTNSNHFNASNPKIGQNTFSLLIETQHNNSLPYIPTLQTLTAQGLSKMNIEPTKLSTLQIQKIDSVSDSKTVRNTSPNQLILEGGLLFWNEGYGNQVPEGAQYESPLTSFQLQGFYKKNLKRNYFVMAGLQYQQLRSRFQYSNIIPEYNLTLEDVVIQVQNNVLTGKQDIIRGDIELTVPAERRVIHYNQSKLFKMSMMVGKAWRFNSFQTDVYFGGSLNRLIYNQGRTLFAGSVVDYNQSSSSFTLNQWTADGIFGLRLHYFLNPKIGLTTGFQAQKSLMNWSTQEGTNSFPTLFSLQWGVSYSLK